MDHIIIGKKHPLQGQDYPLDTLYDVYDKYTHPLQKIYFGECVNASDILQKQKGVFYL